jgi:hypothetical protein
MKLTDQDNGNRRLQMEFYYGETGSETPRGYVARNTVECPEST